MRIIVIAGLLAAAVAGPAAAQTFYPGNPVTDGNPYPVKQAGPLRGTSTSTAGTIAQANTYQSALAADPVRKGCTIQNKSTAAMRVFIGAPAAATDARALDLPAGGTFSCTVGLLVIPDEVSLASATAGSAYLVVRQ